VITRHPRSSRLLNWSNSRRCRSAGHWRIGIPRSTFYDLYGAAQSNPGAGVVKLYRARREYRPPRSERRRQDALRDRVRNDYGAEEFEGTLHDADLVIARLIGRGE
jgi:hypothetical protein